MAKLESGIITHIPRDFALAPVFPYEPSVEKRIVKLNDNRVYVINGNLSGESEESFRGIPLSIDHLFDLLAILYLKADQNRKDGKVYFSLEEILYYSGRKKNGREVENLVKRLKQLKNCEFSVFNEDMPTDKKEGAYIYTIIESLTFYREVSRNKKVLKDQGIENQEEFGFVDNLPKRKSYLTLTEDFQPLLEKTIGIDLGIIKTINSKLGKNIYIYIVARGAQRTKEDPWQINLTTLYEKLGIKDKDVRYKSTRLKKLTQGKNPILAKLDNSRTIDSRILHVEISETRDKSDYKLICWAEENKANSKTLSKMEAEWISYGGSRTFYLDRMKKARTEIEYEYIRIMAIIGIEREDLENAHLLAVWCRLISLCSGVHPKIFPEVLSELKASKLESKTIFDNPGGILYTNTMNRLRIELKEIKEKDPQSIIINDTK